MRKMGAVMLVVIAVMFMFAAWLPFVGAQDIAQDPGTGITVTDVTDVGTLIMLAALVISEGLAFIPGWQANGVLHAVIVGLRKALQRRALPVVLLAVMMGLSACTSFGRSVVAQVRADLKTVVVAGCAGQEEIEASVDAVMSELDPGTTLTEAQQKAAIASASADALCAAVEAIQAAKQTSEAEIYRD